MCGDSGIDSVIITNPARVARQQNKLHGGIFTPALNDIDLADSYVPFEPPQSPGADSINTENMLGNTAALILIVGFIFGLVLLGSMIATGDAIPSMQGVSYVQKGR